MSKVAENAHHFDYTPHGIQLNTMNYECGVINPHCTATIVKPGPAWCCAWSIFIKILTTCAGWTTPELEQVAPSRSAAACAVLDSAENIIIQFLSPLSNSRFYSLTRRKWRKEKTRFQGKEVLTTINAASSYSSPCCYLYLSLAHFKVIIRIIVYI